MKKVFCGLAGENGEGELIPPGKCTPTKHKICQLCKNKGRNSHKKSALKSRRKPNMFGNADRFFEQTLIYLSLFQANDLSLNEEKFLKELEEHFKSTAENILSDFQTKCEQGNNKMIPNIINALAEYALDQSWFINGLKSLHNRGIEITLPGAPPEHWVDYTKNFIWGRKLESKTKKEAIRNDKAKTKYYCLFHGIWPPNPQTSGHSVHGHSAT
jgi:hypothetical protein